MPWPSLPCPSLQQAMCPPDQPCLHFCSAPSTLHLRAPAQMIKPTSQDLSSPCTVQVSCLGQEPAACPLCGTVGVSATVHSPHRSAKAPTCPPHQRGSPPKEPQPQQSHPRSKPSSQRQKKALELPKCGSGSRRKRLPCMNCSKSIVSPKMLGCSRLLPADPTPILVQSSVHPERKRIRHCQRTLLPTGTLEKANMEKVTIPEQCRKMGAAAGLWAQPPGQPPQPQDRAHRCRR